MKPLNVSYPIEVREDGTPRVTLAFREEYFNDNLKRWIYKNPEKPHFGTDLAPFPASYGEPIFACFDGEIVQKVLGSQTTGYGHRLALKFRLPFRAKSIDRQGRPVLLPENSDLYATYAHLDAKMFVKTDDIVRAGQIIASNSDSGFAQGAHLHFEIISDGVKVDPMPVLKQAFDYRRRALEAAKEKPKKWEVKIYGDYDRSKNPVTRVDPERSIIFIAFKDPV